MSDAMEATRQDMQQEAADKLVGGQGHDLVAFSAVVSIILVAERDAVLVEADQPPVRDGYPVGIARQIGEHCLGTSKGWFCVHNPALLPHRCQVPQEGPAVSQIAHGSKEVELPCIMKGDEPGKEEAAEKLAQNTYRQEEGGTRGYPARPVVRDAPAWHDHVDMGMVGHG